MPGSRKYKQEAARQQTEKKTIQKASKKKETKWRQETVPYAPQIGKGKEEEAQKSEETKEAKEEEVALGFAKARRQLEAEETRRKRARGRRQRGEQQVEVVTVNSSGLPQIIAAVKYAATHKGSVAAVLCQEHHKREEAVADMQAATRAVRAA